MFGRVIMWENMFCRSSWTCCILRSCLLLQWIPSSHVTWISLAVWRKRALCQLLFLWLSKKMKTYWLQESCWEMSFPDRTGRCTRKLSWHLVCSCGCCWSALFSQLTPQIPCFAMRKKPWYIPLFLTGRIKEKYSVFLNTQKMWVTSGFLGGLSGWQCPSTWKLI